ncbi:exo-alpha-sialidase [Lonepinella sp. BR2271]|uniref:exo-alpha-sialidase n=1 Tax=Lonepinella sp. BR2271 TaxID=3434550 RepID=UPI003F6DC84A
MAVKTNAITNVSDYTTVTYVFDDVNNKTSIYVNGEYAGGSNSVNFLSSISGLDTAYIGQVKRSNNQSMSYSGDISYAGVISDVLTEEQVKETYQNTLSTEANIKIERAYQTEKHDGLGAYKTDKYAIYQGTKTAQPDDATEAFGYRIPALLTTKDGVVIAVSDKRYKHWSDWGNIDTVIRRSLDGGITWENTQTVVNLESQKSYGDVQSAFMIDPLLVQDKNTGRVFMLVDMFPESGGYNSVNTSSGADSGYILIDGKHYQLLTDKNNRRYTIREGGVVYDSHNNPTDYRVVVEGDPKHAFKDLGNIYQGETLLGNVYLNSSDSNASPFRIYTHSYLWLTYSDNNGETWSSPVDVTHQVKKDWMQFLGTGPGTGLQLQDGSLVMPVYYTNKYGKQSSALIISKDGGETWKMGDSPNDSAYYYEGGSQQINRSEQELTESQVIQLNNGDIKMFSRNTSGHVKISTSKDGGYTWDSTIETDQTLLEPYSQMSVIKYSKLIDGKEYVVFANPHVSARPQKNGMAWLGEVQEDGSILWKYNTSFEVTGTDPNVSNQGVEYGYNSLTELPDGSIGILYESRSGYDIQYVRFNLEEFLWKDNYIHRDIRDTVENNKEVTLNSPREDNYYKIGDGEMIKVGKGKNLANLEVREGIATLNQSADEKGDKQAYAKVDVKANATVRLADSEQLNFSNLTLEKDANLDLNGVNIEVQNGENEASTGLRSAEIVGNIINTAENQATFTYGVNGSHNFSGYVGNVGGDLNLVYAPETAESKLTLSGTAFLNDVTVNKGTLLFAGNVQHADSNAISVAGDAKFIHTGALTVGINNNNSDMSQWDHGSVIVEGDYRSATQTPVNIVLSGDVINGASDKNHDGHYDADEGVSLVQVYGDVDRIDAFALGTVAEKVQSAYQFELVSFEKERAGNYYDYQLHRKLIREDGKPISNVVYAKLPDTPTVELPDGTIQEEPIRWRVLDVGLEAPTYTMPTAGADVFAAAEARYQIQSQVPSYLVANSAAMYQGTTVRDMFTDNLWAKQKKGFYVEQRHTRSDYKTDLGFADYGYNYESIQNTTLFGSYMPVSDSTELHAGVAFSQQKVTPKAADGYSSTKYKSTSLMLAMHNEWNNVLLNTHLGIHWHDGKVSATERNIATIKGEQYQIGTELGYKFKLGQFSVTPVAGLSYQHFDMSIDDKSSAQLKVHTEPFKVFSQHVGSYFGWENDHVDLNVGALYEHHNENNKQVVVNGDRFNTGSLDNAVVVKANADFKLTPQFRLGLQVNHRHSVSDSKVKQTNVGAKLEYQF